MSYEEIKKEIESAPKTWLPALLQSVAEQCCEKNVFVAGGMAAFVESIERRHLAKTSTKS